MVQLTFLNDFYVDLQLSISLSITNFLAVKWRSINICRSSFSHPTRFRIFSESEYFICSRICSISGAFSDVARLLGANSSVECGPVPDGFKFTIWMLWRELGFELLWQGEAEEWFWLMAFNIFLAFAAGLAFKSIDSCVNRRDDWLLLLPPTKEASWIYLANGVLLQIIFNKRFRKCWLLQQ